MAKTTFVCCIESGWLEQQTLRVLESIRRWGGEFSNCPAIAVTPRFGSPLTPATRRKLDELQVTHLNPVAPNPYSWFSYFNKPLALVAAEGVATTPQITWLDSDVLVAAEPKLLELASGEDFAACAFDKNVGSAGPDDPNEIYHRRLYELFHLDRESTPWITTEAEHARIRLLWNSGVFSYRRSTGFAEQYLDVCARILDSKIGARASGIFYTDQAAAPITVLLRKMSWRALPRSHNYSLGIASRKYYDRASLKEARIIHYHDATWPKHFDELIRILKEDHAEVAAWLASIGPVTLGVPPHIRLFNRILREVRSLQGKRHTRSVELV